MTGDECEHVHLVRDLANFFKVAIYSEHGAEPQGWVNAHCEQCGVTYEVPGFGLEDEDEDDGEEEED